MRKILTTIFLFAGLMFGAAGQANSESLLILDGFNNLYGVDTATPGIISTTNITGLRPGETIRGIDFRPATGQLYGISLSGVYIINPLTGAATPVSNLSTPLDPASYGVDFDPVEDRLRVVNEITLKNQRIDVDTGQVTNDAPLRYAMGDLNAGEAPTILGIAYSFDGATSTRLYGIDSDLFQGPELVTLKQPETGIIDSIGPIGVTTRNNAGLVGFDISELTNIAYAVLIPDSNLFSAHLYTIDLNTGAATLVGAIGNTRLSTIGLAAPVRLSQAPVPEPTTVLLLGSGVVGVLFKTRQRHQVR